jgi:hypothetical protein
MLSYFIHKSLPRKFPFSCSLLSPVATQTLSTTFYTTRAVVRENKNRAGPALHKAPAVEFPDVSNETAKPDVAAVKTAKKWVPKVKDNVDRAGPILYKAPVAEVLDVSNETAKPDGDAVKTATKWVPKVKINVNRAGPILYKAPVVEALDVSNETAKPDADADKTATKWVPKVKSSVNRADPALRKPSNGAVLSPTNQNAKSKIGVVKSVPKVQKAAKTISMDSTSATHLLTNDETKVPDVVVRKWVPKALEGAVVDPIPKAEVSSVY